MRRVHSCRLGQSRWDVIIGILLGVTMLAAVPIIIVNLIYPNYGIRYNNGRGDTINNLKQVTLALHSYNDVNKQLPPAFDQSSIINYPVSIHVHMLPYIEQEPLFKAYVAKKTLQNGSLDDQVVSPFLSPLDRTVADCNGWQNFGANLRVFSDKGLETPLNMALPELTGIEPGTGGIPKTFTDGTSNTIVFSTRFGKCGEGGSRYAADPTSLFGAYIGENAAAIPARPGDVRGTFLHNPKSHQCLPRPFMAQSFNDAGIMVGLGDGSVRVVTPTISPETWNRAMQPNDGGTLGSDW